MDNNHDRSLAFDLAVDAGIQVPMYCEIDDYVARVYHHGESEWEGYRFCSLISKVFDTKKKKIGTVPKIKIEKYLHTLYELTSGSCQQAMFSPVKHYLEQPATSEIRVQSDWRLHGVTLGVEERLHGLHADGAPRYNRVMPGVYWLTEQDVFKNVSGGIALHDKALTKFHCEQNMPGEVFSPVAKLFGYLETKLPRELTTVSDSGKKIHWSHDDIILLLSSCPNTRTYLRSIAEDAYLMAQSWSKTKKSDKDFIIDDECRQASGEIFKKTLVYLSKDKILIGLKKHAEEQGEEDDFNLLISPLFVEKDDFSGERNVLKGRIEDRCHMLFICVEAISLEGKGSEGTKRRALMDYIVNNRNFSIPNDRVERMDLAKKICDEVIDMFPPLIGNLSKNKDVAMEEFYVFNDMRDSSLPSTEKSAEQAKNSFIEGFDKLVKLRSREHIRLHVNRDLNDEKNIYVNSVELIKEVLQKMIRSYSSYNKYARIGVVMNMDTLENAGFHRELPSSPTNYSVAKKMGEFLKNSDGTIDDTKHKDLDKRHANQNHGIIAISNRSGRYINLHDILPGLKKFTVLDEFLSSSQQGWIKIDKQHIEVGQIEVEQTKPLLP